MNLLACYKNESKAKPKTKGEIIPVKVMELKWKSISSTIPASGTFSTKDESQLPFKVGRIVSEIMMQECDAVKKVEIPTTLDLAENQSGWPQSVQTCL